MTCARATVQIAKLHPSCADAEKEQATFRLLDDLRERKAIELPKDATIVVKANICTTKGFETGATVDPVLVRKCVEWILRNHSVKKIYIAEADATELDADVAFDALCWRKTFAGMPNVELMNLSKDERVSAQPSRFLSRNLAMSKRYMEADYLISVGKLKTHSICGMTCILKNQFGSLPHRRKVEYHRLLNAVILEANWLKPPNLCVVDGIISMEGEGPVNGIPKPTGLLLVGNDAVATDLVCAKIMGLRWNSIPYLRLAIKKGLGNKDYDVYGKSVEEVRTRFKSPSSFRRLVMKAYRSDRVSRLVSSIVGEKTDGR
jgi:uncharacterized protein (DUF362 family)